MGQQAMPRNPWIHQALAAIANVIRRVACQGISFLELDDEIMWGVNLKSQIRLILGDESFLVRVLVRSTATVPPSSWPIDIHGYRS